MGLSLLSALECSQCHTTTPPNRLQNLCAKCGRPLWARYDLEKAKEVLTRDTFAKRAPTMWRYYELLPVDSEDHIATLGEGVTPLLHLARLGHRFGLGSLLLKDEGQNPTGTFKARGLSVAVSKAKELGARRLAIPTAGNAGAALAAYGAAAGLESLVVAPRSTPPTALTEVEMCGAELELVDGTIAEAVRRVQERLPAGYFDVSTFKEPYRVEGKKTIAFEILEALNWTVPDVVVAPTGGGTGLLAVWKGLDELEALGFIGSRRPRLVAVQSEGCAPLVAAFRAGRDRCDPWPQPKTIAAGLCSPKPFADDLILQALRQSRGTAVAVSDERILQAARDLARYEGLFVAPEGAATAAALETLVADRWVHPKESIVLLNTGTGLKYASLYAAPATASARTVPTSPR